MKLKKSVSQHTVEAYAVCACSYVLRCTCTCSCTNVQEVDRAYSTAIMKAPSSNALGDTAKRTV